MTIGQHKHKILGGVSLLLDMLASAREYRCNKRVLNPQGLMSNSKDDELIREIIMIIM
jgi:hypothetical protein